MAERWQTSELVVALGMANRLVQAVGSASAWITTAAVTLPEGEDQRAAVAELLAIDALLEEADAAMFVAPSRAASAAERKRCAAIVRGFMPEAATTGEWETLRQIAEAIEADPAEVADAR